MWQLSPKTNHSFWAVKWRQHFNYIQIYIFINVLYIIYYYISGLYIYSLYVYIYIDIYIYNLVYLLLTKNIKTNKILIYRYYTFYINNIICTICIENSINMYRILEYDTNIIQHIVTHLGNTIPEVLLRLLVKCECKCSRIVISEHPSNTTTSRPTARRLRGQRSRLRVLASPEQSQELKWQFVWYYPHQYANDWWDIGYGDSTQHMLDFIVV